MPASANLEPIYVTGLGIVSALGTGWAEHVHSLREHRLPFRPVQRFDVSQRIAKTAALVDLPTERLFQRISPRQEAHVDHGTKLLLLAMREALSQARISPTHIHAMPIGTSAAAMELGEKYCRQLRHSPHKQSGQLSLAEHYQPQRQMTTLAEELHWPGQVTIVSNACASGANAIGMGLEMLRRGRAQCVVAGGYDAISELVFSGFDSLHALAPSGLPRPFDAQRDGLALGEGAGVLVLETASHAQKRGASPLAQLSGYHTATDLHHLTQPDPTGTAAIRTMTQASAMAGLEPEQIHYINSHGTGTPYNDVAEGAAIQAWAGKATAGIAVSSTKSAMGHLLGGAGAVEAALCVMALHGQWLPASLNVRTPDPIVTFDLVQSFRPQAQLSAALTNSFGFGGTNASLVFQAASS
jgi:3-oxoacyl-[acyl-carrier-protein] synthase II